MSRPLLYVILSCVLTLFQIFPTMFKPEKSTSCPRDEDNNSHDPMLIYDAVQLLILLSMF